MLPFLFVKKREKFLPGKNRSNNEKLRTYQDHVVIQVKPPPSEGGGKGGRRSRPLAAGSENRERSDQAAEGRQVALITVHVLVLHDTTAGQAGQQAREPGRERSGRPQRPGPQDRPAKQVSIAWT